ncbi:hypothetical protein J6590_062543 [Homalodisca vitripennis]|nr:hypothetical protein J6590_062543 [Homalodisca vitripennis]
MRNFNLPYSPGTVGSHSHYSSPGNTHNHTEPHYTKQWQGSTLRISITTLSKNKKGGIENKGLRDKGFILAGGDETYPGVKDGISFLHVPGLPVISIANKCSAIYQSKNKLIGRIISSGHVSQIGSDGSNIIKKVCREVSAFGVAGGRG